MNDACTTHRERMARSVFEGLDDGERREMEAHAAGCAACGAELASWTATAETMRAAADVPAPRHFFVYPDAARVSPWEAFRRLGTVWRFAVAGIVVAAVAVAALSMTQLRIRSEAGVFMVSFGASPEQRLAQAWEPRLLQAAEQSWREDDRRWAAALREHVDSIQGSQAEQARELVAAGFDSLGQRLDRAMTAQTVALESRTDRAISDLYVEFATRRNEDLSRVAYRLDGVASHNRIQDERTDAVVAALRRMSTSNVN